MRRTVRLATGLAAFGITGLVAMPAAVAQTVDCAVYPDRCVESDVVVDRQPTADVVVDRQPTADVVVDRQPTADVVVDRQPGVVVADTVQDREQTGVSTATNASSLPFTGGEVVLLSVVGAGALAAGTALVVAGRRRSGTTV